MSNKFKILISSLILVITSCGDNNTIFLDYQDVDGVWEKQNEVKFSFNTVIGYWSQTGVPVPVYAYGPGSENFTGTMDNTDVYRAMVAALDLSCLLYTSPSPRD